MKTMELFCGTKSFSKVAEKYGLPIYTIDNEKVFDPSRCEDILELDIRTLPKDIDIIWASPPCQSFSVATIGRNWKQVGGKPQPKSKNAELGLQLLERTLEIIKELKPKYWFIENPRGMMRKMECMQGFKRNTVTYCQYGDTRMKPTDIWTNFTEWNPRPPCKNGSPCHISAPRGSRTGTQGLKNATERGRIPEDLFVEIFSLILSNKQE